MALLCHQTELKHFSKKWEPVFREKMRQNKESGRLSSKRKTQPLDKTHQPPSG